MRSTTDRWYHRVAGLILVTALWAGVILWIIPTGV